MQPPLGRVGVAAAQRDHVPQPYERLLLNVRDGRARRVVVELLHTAARSSTARPSRSRSTYWNWIWIATWVTGSSKLSLYSAIIRHARSIDGDHDDDARRRRRRAPRLARRRVHARRGARRPRAAAVLHGARVPRSRVGTLARRGARAGKKLRKAREWYAFDFGVFEPDGIVPDRRDRRRLYCRLTETVLNRIPEEGAPAPARSTGTCSARTSARPRSRPPRAARPPRTAARAPGGRAIGTDEVAAAREAAAAATAGRGAATAGGDGGDGAVDRRADADADDDDAPDCWGPTGTSVATTRTTRARRRPRAGGARYAARRRAARRSGRDRARPPRTRRRNDPSRRPNRRPSSRAPRRRRRAGAAAGGGGKRTRSRLGGRRAARER